VTSRSPSSSNLRFGGRSSIWRHGGGTYGYLVLSIARPTRRRLPSRAHGVFCWVEGCRWKPRLFRCSGRYAVPPVVRRKLGKNVRALLIAHRCPASVRRAPWPKLEAAMVRFYRGIFVSPVDYPHWHESTLSRYLPAGGHVSVAPDELSFGYPRGSSHRLRPASVCHLVRSRNCLPRLSKGGWIPSNLLLGFHAIAQLSQPE